MKRELHFKLMLGFLLMMFMPITIWAASSDYPNYFTMGENDTIRLSASDLGGEITLPMHAHFSELVKSWDISLTYPNGMTPISAERTSAMDVHYLDSMGNDQVFQAWLNHGEGWSTISSSIGVQCYHDPYGAGSYLPYGTATWTPGDYDAMFNMTFVMDDSFNGGSLTLSCFFKIKSPGGDGSHSSYGACYATMAVIVEYESGDVNGDGQVNITDVTLLISMLLNESQDEMTDSCDVNGDGEINITDVTQLINIVMHQ